VAAVRNLAVAVRVTRNGILLINPVMPADIFLNTNVIDSKLWCCWHERSVGPSVTGWFEHLKIPAAVIAGKSVQTYKRRPWMAPHWGSLALMIAILTFPHQISHAFNRAIFRVFKRL
jgi:hypothetical protein